MLRSALCSPQANRASKLHVLPPSFAATSRLLTPSRRSLTSWGCRRLAAPWEGCGALASRWPFQIPAEMPGVKSCFAHGVQGQPGWVGGRGMRWVHDSRFQNRAPLRRWCTLRRQERGPFDLVVAADCVMAALAAFDSSRREAKLTPQNLEVAHGVSSDLLLATNYDRLVSCGTLQRYRFFGPILRTELMPKALSPTKFL